jgi:hypothetical protein
MVAGPLISKVTFRREIHIPFEFSQEAELIYMDAHSRTHLQKGNKYFPFSLSSLRRRAAKRFGACNG